MLNAIVMDRCLASRRCIEFQCQRLYPAVVDRALGLALALLNLDSNDLAEHVKLQMIILDPGNIFNANRVDANSSQAKRKFA